MIEIVGEPGVGKSRLTLELAATLAPNANLVSSHCVAYGSQAPNVPIAALAKGLCQIAASDDFAAPARAIAKTISPERADDASYLGALLGLPDAIERIRMVDPATARGRTTAALIALVHGAAVREPVVRIVEDLQWVDASAMDYLSALATAIGDLCAVREGQR